jgi:hypothetical protein
MLSLFLTRSKIFEVTTADGANHRVAVSRTTDGRTVAVPDWVKTTTTYQFGVKDGSIRDLTPPTTKRVRRTKADDEPALAPTPASVDTTDADDPAHAAAEDAVLATAVKPKGKQVKAGASTGLKA